MSSKQFVLGAMMALSIASAAAATMTPVEVSEADAAAYKARVTDSLKDPESVQWRNVRFGQVIPGPDFKGTPSGPVMCAEFNAKNSYGGYTGFKPVAVLGNAMKTVVSIPDFAATLCQ